MRQTDNDGISLKEYMLACFNERDRRYEERFIAQEKALNAALIANKELTAQAAASNKEAVAKAALELDQYKLLNNEWRGTINDWRQTLMPRSEYTVKQDSVDKQIAELQKFRNETGGSKETKAEDRGRVQWSVGLVVAVVLSAISTIIALAMALWKR